MLDSKLSDNLSSKKLDKEELLSVSGGIIEGEAEAPEIPDDERLLFKDSGKTDKDAMNIRGKKR